MSSVQGCGTRVFDYCTEIPLVDVARRVQPIWMDPLPLPLSGDPLILPSERPPNSRPCSGRVSGLRGQLLSRRESEPLSLLHSSSSHLPTCLDDHTPRLKTAVSTVEAAKISDYFLTPRFFIIIQVLSKGRLPLSLLSTGSDTCLLLPSVDSSWDGEGERAKVAHCLIPRSPCTCCLLCKITQNFILQMLNTVSICTVLIIILLSFQLPSAPPPPTPPISLTEPASSAGPRPPTALEQSLASISQFDHTHLGQIGKGTQGKDQTHRLQK